MPYIGHFMTGTIDCRFRLSTYVNGYIISTIGEIVWHNRIGYQRATLNRAFYETTVFKATPFQNPARHCCEYELDVDNIMDTKSYGESKLACDGHIVMCEKWDYSPDDIPGISVA